PAGPTCSGRKATSSAMSILGYRRKQALPRQTSDVHSPPTPQALRCAPVAPGSRMEPDAQQSVQHLQEEPDVGDLVVPELADAAGTDEPFPPAAQPKREEARRQTERLDVFRAAKDCFAPAVDVEKARTDDQPVVAVQFEANRTLPLEFIEQV